jgi:hypothetical protein
MPLISLWRSNASAVGEFSIEQVVSAAGDGSLKDGSVCSQELREYFSEISSEKLAEYIEHCLTSSFHRSGMVLQDLINELGRRLDYAVTNGRYQGTTNAIGFDGCWKSPEAHSVVVEIKTTDAYRISLETIATYRERLKATGQVSGSSSILIVVGREDTGELEAQVRGSRYAWDIRLISADALIKLVQLKENSEEAETGQKIRSVLSPVEYTRLDDLIDVMFTTAKDVDSVIARSDPDLPQGGTKVDKEPRDGQWEFTDSALLQAKRESIFAAVEKTLGVKLVRKSRALYWDSEHLSRVACTISKRYERGPSYRYWYAYHPQWDAFLQEGKSAFFVLGGMDLPFAFAVPWRVIHEVLDVLNTTETKDTTYWHIHVGEGRSGEYELLLPKQASNLPLNAYRLALQN